MMEMPSYVSCNLPWCAGFIGFPAVKGHKLSDFMGSFKPNEIDPLETSLTVLVAVLFERNQCIHRIVQD